jgi:hypothetical protein
MSLRRVVVSRPSKVWIAQDRGLAAVSQASRHRGAGSTIASRSSNPCFTGRRLDARRNGHPSVAIALAPAGAAASRPAARSVPSGSQSSSSPNSPARHHSRSVSAAPLSCPLALAPARAAVPTPIAPDRPMPGTARLMARAAAPRPSACRGRDACRLMAGDSCGKHTYPPSLLAEP